MIKRAISYLGSSLLWCCLTLPAKAESTLMEIQRTGILKVAIREDAAPFGYVDSKNKLQGYCLDFFTLLEEQLIKNLERSTLSVKLFKSTTNNRFSLVSSDIVHLECGPNTIGVDLPENTNFSTAFSTTKTQFLIKEENHDRFKLDRDLERIKLGVIKNTTTEKFIIDTYPSATIYQFSGITARNRGVQAVSQGKIDAMISDGVLLRAEIQRQGLSTSQYSLISKNSLTCDRYGMIVNQDSQWINFVDSVIKSPESAALSQAWFGNKLDSDRLASDSCN